MRGPLQGFDLLLAKRFAQLQSVNIVSLQPRIDFHPLSLQGWLYDVAQFALCYLTRAPRVIGLRF
jgi:hypothetical protein